MANSYNFHDELSQWGPESTAQTKPERMTVERAEAYCRSLALRHYENFPVVTWMLPRRLRQHFCNIYAYCRWADDLGDECGSTEKSLKLLAWWREELIRCYAGDVSHPVFVALAGTIAQFAIPQQPFDDLISAFEQDQRISEYESSNQLLDYCTRSANPVGRLLLYLCGEYNDQNVRWSDSICTGLQLANFWQDVSRDYDIGRIYLPADHRAMFGYTNDALHARRTNDAFLALMQHEVEWAREFLIAGLPLVKALPGRLQIDIDLFARGGLAILRAIEAEKYRVWDVRPKISKAGMFPLFLSSCCRALFRAITPTTLMRNSEQSQPIQSPGGKT